MDLGQKPQRRLTTADLEKIHEIVKKGPEHSTVSMSREEELVRIWFIKGWEMMGIYGPHSDVNVILEKSIAVAKELGKDSGFLEKKTSIRPAGAVDTLPPTPKFNYDFNKLDD